jgi:CubicO group peptidase (beta-lactamase class C family)
MSLGLYMQELIRHVDPAKRTLGRFFHDEIAGPLGLDFYIGLPPEFPDERLAAVKTLSLGRALRSVMKLPGPMVRKMLQPHSMVRHAFLLADLDWNDRRLYDIELPAGNGVGTARAIARAYSAFAEGGSELAIPARTMAEIVARPPIAGDRDEVLGLPTYFSLGFMRPTAGFAFGSTSRAFGAPGAGGSFGFADPDAHLGYAYVMNKLDFYLSDDPREKALRDAIYRAVDRATQAHAA